MCSMKSVYAIYGDIGGAKEVLPAMQVLAERGTQVNHFVYGDRARAGTDVLEAAGIPYETRTPVPSDRPSVIVVGTSATAVEGQIAWTRFGEENNIPVIWVEDLWGTGESQKTRDVSPDIMCVVDDIAARIAKGVRSHIQTEVVGKPSFGALANKLHDVEQIRATTRAQIAARLGIKDFDGHIVTFGSGGEVPARAFAHVEALCDHGGLDAVTNKEVIFVPRLHPKLPEKDKRELRILAQAVGSYVVAAHDLDMDFITVASDVNLGEWGSTSMYTSAIFGIPPVMCMFPDDRERRLAAGYPNGEPPLLLAGAGYGPTDAVQLHDVLNQILCDPLKQYHEMTFQKGAVFRSLLEPGAEERIADVVMRSL